MITLAHALDVINLQHIIWELATTMLLSALALEKQTLYHGKQYLYTLYFLLSSTAIEPVKRRIPSDLRN